MHFPHSLLVIIFIYALLVGIWATTPLAVVWTTQELVPLWALLLRYLMASVIMLSLLLLIKQRLATDRQSLTSYLAGSLNLIGAQLFIYLAATTLHSGMMVLIYAFAPLIAGLIEHFLLKSNRLQLRQWLGMLVALSGLIFILTEQGQAAPDPFGVLLMFISVLCYICSIFWVKKINANLSPMSQATGALVISALAALLFLPFIWEDAPTQIPSMQSGLAFLFTVLMSSIVAMLCYFWLIPRLPASTFALSNLMTPGIALSLGVILNAEPMSAHLMFGLVLVLLGMIIYFFGKRASN